MSMSQQASGYGIYLAYLDDYLRQLGEDSAALFRAAGIEDVSSIRQGQRIPLDTLARVFGRVHRHARLGGFFLAFGAQIPVTAHGILGLAFMSCRDIRGVLHMLERYSALALPSVSITLDEQGSEALIGIRVSTPYADFNTSLVEALVVNVTRNIDYLSGHAVCPLGVTFMQRQPAYAEHFARWIAAPVRFGGTANSLRYPRAILDLPLATANELNQRLMVEQCEEELRRVSLQTRLADRVRDLLSLQLNDNPSIGFVASQLSLSERTLRRRLAEEGISFRDLLNGVRHDMAIHYLRDTDARIEQIAMQLGYRDTACFRSAFKSLTGLSPRAWRNSRAADPATAKV